MDRSRGEPAQRPPVDPPLPAPGPRESAPGPPQTPPPSLTVVLLNLSVFVATGASVSLWLLYRTDWYLAAGGFATALAWLAVVSSLLSKERKAELLALLEQKVLSKSYPWVTLLVLLGLFLGLGSGLTRTLVINSHNDTVGRRVRVFDPGSGEGASPETVTDTFLPARSTRKLLLFGRGPIVAKASQLPQLRIERFRGRRTLFTPESFRESPVVLVRPEYSLAQTARELAARADRHLSLVVRVNGESLGPLEPYRGSAVFVGCDEDVKISAHIEAAWRDPRGANWLPPTALAQIVRLSRSDAIEAALLKPNGEAYVRSPERVVDELLSGGDFMGELILRVPDN